jgi:hypothetical protein
VQRTKSRRRRLHRPEKLTIAVAHPVPAFVLLALGKHPECSVARPRMSNCCRVNQYQSLGSLLRQSSIRFDRALDRCRWYCGRLRVVGETVSVEECSRRFERHDHLGGKTVSNSFARSTSNSLMSDIEGWSQGINGRNAGHRNSVAIDLSRPFAAGLQCHAEQVRHRGGTSALALVDAGTV